MFAVGSLRGLLEHFIRKHDIPLTILVLNGQNLKAENTFSQACSGTTTMKPLAAWQVLLLWSFKSFVKET